MISKLLLSTAAFAALTVGVHAADLMMEAPAPVVAPEPAGWDGAYIGASIGYGPGAFTFDDCVGGGNTVDDCSIDFAGLFGGIQGGYNFSVGDSGVVLGIEGDVNWAHETGEADYQNGGSDQVGVDWTGAVTGHVGVAVGNIMPYALGGIAFAHSYDARTYGPLIPLPPIPNNSLLAAVAPEGDDNADATHVGYTLGAGVGVMFSDNVSGFIEARYSDYGSRDYNFSPSGTTNPISLTDTTVKGGINFHF